MRRWLPAAITAMVIIVAAAFLSAEAVDPGNFAGRWYSSVEHVPYTFQNGLISCENQGCWLTNGELFSGAYCFSRDKVVLFAAGIEGLETEKELYLVRCQGTDMLCENENGTGRVFFYRENAIIGE